MKECKLAHDFIIFTKNMKWEYYIEYPFIKFETVDGERKITSECHYNIWADISNSPSNGKCITADEAWDLFIKSGSDLPKDTDPEIKKLIVELRDIPKDILHDVIDEIVIEGYRIPEFTSVSDLATILEKTFSEIIGKCMYLGIMVSINHKLDADTIKSVSKEFGYDVTVIKSELPIEEKEKINMRNRQAMSGDFVYYKRD